jgi:hypothetical protein
VMPGAILMFMLPLALPSPKGHLLMLVIVAGCLSTWLVSLHRAWRAGSPRKYLALEFMATALFGFGAVGQILVSLGEPTW